MAGSSARSAYGVSTMVEGLGWRSSIVVSMHQLMHPHQTGRLMRNDSSVGAELVDSGVDDAGAIASRAESTCRAPGHGATLGIPSGCRYLCHTK